MATNNPHADFTALCGTHGAKPDPECRDCQITDAVMLRGHEAGDCIPRLCWYCEQGIIPRGGRSGG